MKQAKMTQKTINQIIDAYRFYEKAVRYNSTAKMQEKELRQLAAYVISCGGTVDRKRIYEKNYLYNAAKALM